MSTSARLLRLLALLQNHRYWPGAELAERLEISLRTLRRDVDRLRELGYPVSSDRGVGGGYQLAPGAALPPLVIDDEEAVAIAVGLQAAAHSTIAGIEESSVRALTKLVQVLPLRLRRRVDSVRTMTVSALWNSGGSTGPTIDAGTLTTIAQACRDSEGLEFTYTTSGGERSARRVEPHRLVCLGRRWYLVAYDLTRHDWRSFRLDRIGEPHRAGTRFRPRQLPAADAAAFVRAGITTVSTRYDVEAIVHAPADAVRAEVGRWGTVTEIDDQRCRLRMAVDTLDWPAMALGAIGAEFDILSPPELIDYIGDWGRRFTRAANPRPETPSQPDNAGL